MRPTNHVSIFDQTGTKDTIIQTASENIIVLIDSDHTAFVFNDVFERHIFIVAVFVKTTFS